MVTAQQTADLERLMRTMNPNGADNEELITLFSAIFGDNADTITTVGGTELGVAAIDTDYNNTITLGDVAGLVTSSLVVGTKYLVEAVLLIEAASITPDLDIKFVGSVNSTFSWAAGEPADAAVNANTIATEATLPAVAGIGIVKISGILDIVDTAGIFKLQAAQNVATVENTSIKAGSTLKITRIE